MYEYIWLITAATQSNALNVIARSNAGVIGSNPIKGIDICARLFCVVLRAGRELATEG
jgi:hypothetical protein